MRSWRAPPNAKGRASTGSSSRRLTDVGRLVGRERTADAAGSRGPGRSALTWLLVANVVAVALAGLAAVVILLVAGL